MSWFEKLLERAEPKDEDTAKKASVDVAASVALKDRHKKYGDMVRELSKIAKMFYDPFTDPWTYVWAVTLRAFSHWRRGYAVERAIASLRADYEGLLNTRKIEQIVREVYKQAPTLADKYGINRLPEKPARRGARR